MNWCGLCKEVGLIKGAGQELGKIPGQARYPETLQWVSRKEEKEQRSKDLIQVAR